MNKTLLIELGTEELPPKSLKSLALAFRDGIVNGLSERELSHGQVQWFATPRRLAVVIEQLAERAEDKEVVLLGPPADRAKPEAGEWTPAAAGFARKQGVEPGALQEIDTPKGVRLGLKSVAPGARAADSLEAILGQTVSELPIAKRMRWGAFRVEFVRPVHWAVAMLDSEVVKLQVLGVDSANTSRGHRFHHPDLVTIDSAQDYANSLKDAHIIASFDERLRQLQRLSRREQPVLAQSHN